VWLVFSIVVVGDSSYTQQQPAASAEQCILTFTFALSCRLVVADSTSNSGFSGKESVALKCWNSWNPHPFKSQPQVLKVVTILKCQTNSFQWQFEEPSPYPEPNPEPEPEPEPQPPEPQPEPEPTKTRIRLA
jgi:hypothetical protein